MDPAIICACIIAVLLLVLFKWLFFKVGSSDENPGIWIFFAVAIVIAIVELSKAA